MSQIIFFYIIGSPIKHILHDYQPVHYDQLTLKQQHERMRRSLINTMDFEFGTINRYVFITSWKSNTHSMNKSVEQRHVIDYFFHVNFLFSLFFFFTKLWFGDTSTCYHTRSSFICHTSFTKTRGKRKK